MSSLEILNVVPKVVTNNKTKGGSNTSAPKYYFRTVTVVRMFFIVFL